MKMSGSTIGRTFSRVSSTPVGERLQHKAPKPPIAPSSMVISTSCSRASRSKEVDVERLGEARIGDRGREPSA